MSPSLRVPPRFNGPAGSANGGYLSGLAAAYVDGPATVTLRHPPPLSTPMNVETDQAGLVCLSHAGAVVAEAAPAQDSPTLWVPETISIAEARAVEGRARYFHHTVFPDCFVCGPRRRSGDGLRIFPGPVSRRALWAAPWTPNASVADSGGRVLPEMVWAALDCPSGIAAAEAADLDAREALVLGRMTARVVGLPTAGDDYAVIAWPTGRDGRKLTAGSALLRRDGEVLAVARTVWLTVPRPGSVPEQSIAGQAS